MRFDAHRQTHIVNVGKKSSTRRIAVASGRIELIPLCPPLALTRVAVEFESQAATSTCAAYITCIATAETTGPTDVEIEALMSVQIALLTI